MVVTESADLLLDSLGVEQAQLWQIALQLLRLLFPLMHGSEDGA